MVQVVRQIIDTARRGDSIDVGLSITSSTTGSSVSPSTETPNSSGVSSPVPADDDETLLCVFEIHHRLQSPEMPTDGTTPTYPNPPRTSERPDPNFDSMLFRRLLLRSGASLSSEVPDDITSGRTYEVKLGLLRGSPAAISAKSSAISDQPSTLLSGVRLGTEPSLEELTQFAETLRGKKVTLYASTASSFAHHLTSYLTAWGLDVSHVSSEPDADTTPGASEAPAHSGRERGSSVTQDPRGTAMNGSIRPAQALSFVMIDDDVSVLRERLRKYRAEQPIPLNLHSRKRPSLAAHHRPKSSPQVARSLGFGSQAPSPYGPVVVVHFTSLSNYKLVKEIIHCDLASHSYATYPPEVMIIPKPAGPRRFLTALHTAVTKPIVDPFFVPIATSPLSPGLHTSPFFNVPQTSPKSPSSRPSTSARTNSDRSVRSARDGTGDHHPHAPPSPLSLADNMEYFPETQSPVRLGQTPSSGLVISSPDGQPAGIIFQPRPKSAKPVVPSPGGILVDRDKPQFLAPNTDRLRGSTSRRLSDGEQKKQGSSPLSFAALHSNVLGNALEASSPIEGLTPISSTPKAKTKRATSPQADEPVPPSPLSPPSRNINTVDLRKVSSPPGSPTAGDAPLNAAARRPGRRTTHDSKPSTPPTASGKMGKGQPDSSIIPPISVLIVDGMDFKHPQNLPTNRLSR
jgi:osomolarity two-component system response regulator SSK1